MRCIKPSLLSIILILLCAVTSFAQRANPRYDSLWKKADTLIFKKGLTKSALAQVITIYTLAKKERQEAQVIKALVYRMSLQEMVEEDAEVKDIHLLENEISTSTEPARSILRSLLAFKYRAYFEVPVDRSNRTNTKDFPKDDIATWTTDDYHKKVAGLYKAALQNKAILQATHVDTYYNTIVYPGNVQNLRPTLYDLLSYGALDFFKPELWGSLRPANAFEMKEENLFAPAAEFARLSITTTDTASLSYEALLIYQNLLAFHLKDAQPDALIDADIQRIEFVHSYSVISKKDTLYERALMNIFERYPNSPTAAEAAYLVASLHVSENIRYRYSQPIDDDTSDLTFAANLCKKVLQQPGGSKGKSDCYNLLKTIEQRVLHLTTEKVNIPGQPFRTLVNYSNMSRLYLRLIPSNAGLQNRLGSSYDTIYWKRLFNLKPLRSWEQALPVTTDYHKHSTEIKIDALPTGEYILLGSADPGFSLDSNIVAAQQFYVSNISYINNDYDYFVLNRETGQPLANTVIQQWWGKYNPHTGDYTKVKGAQVVTDSHGFARLASRTRSYEEMQVSFYHDKDSLFINQYESSPLAEAVNAPHIDTLTYEKDHADAYLFTDRSLYRPGQTVYFKGISVTKDRLTGKKKPYSGRRAKILLYNANHIAIDSMELMTNTFGSYTGHFKLPSSMYNGQFMISDKELKSDVSFSVEEYKRPKFYVQFDTVRGSYRINDSITVTGSAKAYAGNNIDGAKVSYRVQRLTRFFYPWSFGRRAPSGGNMEIANGELTTAADGSFHLRFKAIPDLSINKGLDPVFDYSVSVDITDAGGETRSGETTVPVFYKAIRLELSLPGGESMPADSFRMVTLNTRNSAGEFISAPATVTISRLKMPGRLIRERLWLQPDQFVMSKEEYLSSFPHDEYNNETDMHSWPKEQAVWQASDSTGPLKPFSVGKQLTNGWYIVEAAARDINGDSVKDVKYIYLFDEKSNTLAMPAYTWSGQDNTSAEPGQQVNIRIGSSADNLFVIQQVDKERDDDDTVVTANVYNFLSINNEKKTISFTPGEVDRGGFGVYHFFVKNNRFYSISNKISVPWSNKELTIQYETFRDKTLPGSEEKWRLKISGPKKEKVAAEMLAGMYDASLDQFKPHEWTVPGIFNVYTADFSWQANLNFQSVSSEDKSWERPQWESAYKQYDIFITGLRMIKNPDGSFRDMTFTEQRLDDLIGRAYTIPVQDWEKDPDGSKGYTKDSIFVNANRLSMLRTAAAPGAMQNAEFRPGRISFAKADVSSYLSDGKPIALDASSTPTPPPQIRKNFNETAFFFPDLQTDSAGDISFGFTMPEALTKWKFQALAHTKDLAFGYTTTNVVTQKPLMVQPNAPRFLREGDRMDFSAKVVNLSDKEQTGTVQLELLNAATNEPADGWFRNMYPVQYFTAEAGQSTVVKFSINVPYQYGSAVVYRFVAKSGDNSDGEEAAMPVLTNTALVTESMPLPIRGNKARNFKFDKLLQSGSSETLQQHALTVEFTSNPAWYAVQALPYLIDYPYECAEQTFNRYYANALSSMIAGAAPKLKTIVDKWNINDTAALFSNLQKNEELKSALLEETPWVLEARTEAQQKKNIALLFDMVRMNAALSSSFAKLKELQTDNGGFVWFKGGHDDRYITQYILSGIGHLKKLHALGDQQKDDWKDVIKSAIAYADRLIKEDYDYLIKHKIKLDQNNLGNSQVQYLYLRSMFNEYSTPGASFTAVNYYRNQSRKYWLQQSKYMQGMIALSLFRTGDIQSAKDIVKSLKENAIVNEELGMYWKDNTAGYYWQQAPIETQSLLIEAFSEISRDNKTTDDLKTWLLKQKQVQNWGTTRATAEACYALLLQGGNWLNNTPEVTIKLGDKTVSSTEQAEAGTGYFKKTFEGPFVNPSMGDISVRVASSPGATPSQSSWGAVYWQYFEQLDKITSAATPLKLDKKLFVERNTDRGPVLEPIAENGYLKVGDKIKVRIELRVDREMEYVHMKDMRASCMEPVNVLSSYKWQDGLGYYESTKDASTSFFFDRLPKGTYVFEYTLFVTHAGNFSNGITTIQCMYAPEFASHSEGIRVNVE